PPGGGRARPAPATDGAGVDRARAPGADLRDALVAHARHPEPHPLRRAARDRRLHGPAWRQTRRPPPGRDVRSQAVPRAGRRRRVRATGACRLALLASEPAQEVRLHLWPVVVDHRVPGGVAALAAPDEHVLAEDALELCGERCKSGPRALVARVGLELDAEEPLALESVLH